METFFFDSSLLITVGSGFIRKLWSIKNTKINFKMESKLQRIFDKCNANRILPNPTGLCLMLVLLIFGKIQ